MFEACKSGSLEVAKWFLEVGAGIRGEGTEPKVTPMMGACVGQHLDVAQWLFAVGAAEDIRTASRMPISMGYFGNVAVTVTPMVAALFFEDEHDQRRLWARSIHYKRPLLRVAKWLFAVGAVKDIHSKDATGKTPTHWVCICHNSHDWQEELGRVSALQWLFHMGAKNVLATDIFGRTPLWFASSDGANGAVEWLVLHGAACGETGHIDPALLIRETEGLGPESVDDNPRTRMCDRFEASAREHANFSILVLSAAYAFHATGDEEFELTPESARSRR